MVFFKRPGQEPGRCRFESCLPDKRNSGRHRCCTNVPMTPPVARRFLTKYGDVSLIVQGSGLENHQ